MAFQTPTYDYGLATNKLTLDKGLSDIAQSYGTFLGQERYRRNRGDMNREFKSQFPKVAQGYQNRGLYNSGLRKQGQRQEVKGYQRAQNRLSQDQAVSQASDAQTQAFRDAQYQQALMDYFNAMQRQRAVSYDPFQFIRGVN